MSGSSSHQREGSEGQRERREVTLGSVVSAQMSYSTLSPENWRKVGGSQEPSAHSCPAYSSKIPRMLKTSCFLGGSSPASVHCHSVDGVPKGHHGNQVFACDFTGNHCCSEKPKGFLGLSQLWSPYATVVDECDVDISPNIELSHGICASLVKMHQEFAQP